jgi:hypothetical protein
MGPVFSGSIIVSMAETRAAETANFTGGEAAGITQQSNPIIGETVLTSQKVVEPAGEAANGAVARVGLTADAPQPLIKKFSDAFQAEYKSKSDHNGLKGYSGMYIVKAPPHSCPVRIGTHSARRQALPTTLPRCWMPTACSTPCW